MHFLSFWRFLALCFCSILFSLLGDSQNIAFNSPFEALLLFELWKYFIFLTSGCLFGFKLPALSTLHQCFNVSLSILSEAHQTKRHLVYNYIMFFNILWRGLPKASLSVGAWAGHASLDVHKNIDFTRRQAHCWLPYIWILLDLSGLRSCRNFVAISSDNQISPMTVSSNNRIFNTLSINNEPTGVYNNYHSYHMNPKMC